MPEGCVHTAGLKAAGKAARAGGDARRRGAEGPCAQKAAAAKDVGDRRQIGIDAAREERMRGRRALPLRVARGDLGWRGCRGFTGQATDRAAFLVGGNEERRVAALRAAA